ncbi:MAG TPA: cytochrome D1 domain-containing protein [Acidobacteriota bacterium]
MRHFLICLTLAAVINSSGAPAESGTLIVLNKSDHTASLLDSASGALRATLPTAPGPHEVDVSPDGKLAVVTGYGAQGAAGNSLTVIDVAAAKVLRSVDLGEYTRPHGIQWAPSGAALYVTAEGKHALIELDPASWKIRRALPTGQEVSHMVALAPKAGRAFVANIGSGSVTAFDLESGELLKQIETGAGAEGIAATPDGAEIWVTNREADTVSVIDPATLEVRATLPAASFPIRVKLTPAGDRALVSCARSGEVVVFDTAARSELKRIKLELAALDQTKQRIFGDRFGSSPVPVGILIEPSGRRAFVASTNADAVSVLDLEQGKVVDVWQVGKEPDGLGYSPLSAGE